MKPTPERSRQIQDVKSLPDHRLRLRWSGGPEAEIDFSPYLERRAFRDLRDEVEFDRVEVGDWGHSLRWPSGVEAGADMLWLDTLSATGHRDTRTFLEWRRRHGLSLNDAARALGVSRRTVAYYGGGDSPVPRHILLACLGWEIAADPTHAPTALQDEVRQFLAA